MTFKIQPDLEQFNKEIRETLPHFVRQSLSIPFFTAPAGRKSQTTGM